MSFLNEYWVTSINLVTYFSYKTSNWSAPFFLSNQNNAFVKHAFTSYFIPFFVQQMINSFCWNDLPEHFSSKQCFIFPLSIRRWTMPTSCWAEERASQKHFAATHTHTKTLLMHFLFFRLSFRQNQFITHIVPDFL